MWYKVYSCNLLLPSLRNLENRLEIKLIVFVLLANSDTYQRKKFDPTPDGGEILVKIQIGVAIMQKEES